MKMKSSKIFFVLLLLTAIAILSSTPVFAIPTDPCQGFNAQITPGNTTTYEKLNVTVQGDANKGTDISCTWTQEPADAIKVTFTPSQCTLSFTAPDVSPTGIELHFTLAVSGNVSGSLCSHSKSTKIAIQNSNQADQAPIASATATPSVVNEGGTVTLDGTTSSDPDGDALTYAWTQTVGTSVTINNASGAIATITAPPEQYPNGETLTFMLTVSDGSLSGSTTVNVTVNSVNQPPVAAILSQCPFSVNEGASVTLDGSGSSDPDLGVLQYQWNQVQGIPNADLTEVDLAQPSISFTAPQLISSLNMMKFGLTVTDNGGLKNDAECEIVVIDVTPPSIECPDFDDTIWYGDNVAVNCSASDVASGLADDTLNSFTLTTSVSAGTETDSALTNSEEVCDKANNCRTAGPYAFKIDKKAPTVICDTADIAWHATDQSVTCTVTDGGSGPASPTLTLSTSVPVGTETSDASTESKSAYDNVGNSATVGPVSGFKIDKKAPSITASATKTDATAYTAGAWTNQSVTVKFTCYDGGSGEKSCGPDVTLSSDGETVSVAGTAVDKVGNTAGATFGPVKIDKTPPTASANASPAPNVNGWNNTDVSVTFSGTDSFSGIASCTADVKLSGEGVGQSALGTCTDNAGNVSAPASKVGINIDKTAPSIAWNGGPDDGGTYYWGFVPAAPTCTATDALSGPNGCTVTGYSSAIGSQTLTATATDLADNTATETRSYAVNAWTLKGFYQPVDMNGVWNTVKNGATVPLKFQVFAGSTELTDIAVIDTFIATSVACPKTGYVADDVEFTTTGNTTLRYDTISHQFIQNWQTPKKPGACYRVTMTTDDGSNLTAYFILK